MTLCGDAAHLLPPEGQGLNLTLEDAAVLGYHLQQQGLREKADAMMVIALDSSLLTN